MQLMGTMAAAGMGTDTPPPGSPPRVPSLAVSPAFEADEEEKRDYRADDEGGDEVDNSLDCTPADDSELSEDYGGDEMKTPPGMPARSEADVVLEPLSPTKDAAVVEKLDVEHHTVIRDSAVVTECLHSVGEGELSETSDKVQQEHKSMAVTASSSSAATGRVASSMLEVGPTEGLSGSINTHSTSAEVNSQNERDVLGEDIEKVNVDTLRLLCGSEGGTSHGEESAQEVSMEISSTEDQEQSADVEVLTVDDDVAVNEAPPSGDLVQQTTEEGSTVPAQRDVQSEKNQKVSSPADQDEQPADTKRAPPCSEPATPEHTNTPTQTKKRMQSSTLPSGSEEPKAPDNNASPNTSPPTKVPAAPSHTPKQSKHAAPKKRKKGPPAIESAASGDEESLPIRRSSRIKHVPPKFTYPAKQLADETVLSHFRHSSPSIAMACKYCGKEMPFSRGFAQKHLRACPAFMSRNKSVVEDDTEEKPALPSPAAAIESEKDVKMEGPMHERSAVSDHAASLLHLMGSEDLAAQLKGAFQGAPFAGHAPISRFQDLIRDDATGLRHLRVQDLLDAVDPLDGQTVLLHVNSAGGRRSTGQESLDPVSKAKARDMENCSLRFPAPRNVADIFIVPIAAELGLDYAMHQHTAKLASCPEQGTAVNWRFHRTEMVVFQLAGKALWKLRMGPVHNPLSCYHPDSWLLDNAAEVDKVHRVCTLKKHALGSLTPPFDELDVFDENTSTQEADEELHEHMLKPGSVAYLPAGTWFETETKEKNVVWLEVQLEAMTYEALLLAAVKQLAWREQSMRMKVQLYPGNRGEARRVRSHMGACMKSLRDEIAVLDTSDLVPEYLVTDDLRDLRAQGLLRETSRSSASTSFEVDLTNPKFKLKHVKVFSEFAYRVNPVAVLRSVDEISHLEKEESEAPTSVTAQHRALKKSPKPKPKRKLGLRVITQAGKHTYVLDEVFGNDDFRSQLHVKFQCSAEQSRLVEWLRSRGAGSFGVEEFSHGDDSRQSKSSARCKETGRHLLRFLCFVGYVSQVKSPKQTRVHRQIAHEKAS
ncbi:hypothetical protein PRIC2_014370 [Phytophthora ramorum]